MIMHEIIFLNIFPKELFILSLIFLCLVVWYFFIACLCFIFSSLLLSGPAPPEMGNIPSFDFAICWIGFNLKFVPCSCRGGHKTFVAPPLFPAFKVLFIEVCINLWLLGGAGSGRLGVGGLHVHMKIVITISVKICRLKGKTTTNPSLLMAVVVSYVGGYSPVKPWNLRNLATLDIYFKNKLIALSLGNLVKIRLAWTCVTS